MWVAYLAKRWVVLMVVPLVGKLDQLMVEQMVLSMVALSVEYWADK